MEWTNILGADFGRNIRQEMMPLSSICRFVGMTCCEGEKAFCLTGAICGKAEHWTYNLQIPGDRIRRQDNPGDRRALLDKQSLVELWRQRFLCDLTTKDQRKLLVFIERKQLLEVLTLCSLFLKKLILLEYRLLYNAVSFSAVRQGESATCIHIFPSLLDFLPIQDTQSTE